MASVRYVGGRIRLHDIWSYPPGMVVDQRSPLTGPSSLSHRIVAVAPEGARVRTFARDMSGRRQLQVPVVHGPRVGCGAFGCFELQRPGGGERERAPELVDHDLADVVHRRPGHR